ncbi:hypothetical protein H4R19_006418, partial [Coemansia spiralis]
PTDLFPIDQPTVKPGDATGDNQEVGSQDLIVDNTEHTVASKSTTSSNHLVEVTADSRTADGSDHTDGTGSADGANSTDSSNSADTPAAVSSGSSKTAVVVVVVLVVLGLAGGGIAWVVFRRRRQRRLATQKDNGWGRDSALPLPRGMRITQDCNPGAAHHAMPEKVESLDATTDILNHYSHWGEPQYEGNLSRY